MAKIIAFPTKGTPIFDNSEEEKKGCIFRRTGSDILHISLRHLGRQFEQTTGLKDTPENRALIRERLNDAIGKLSDGKTFGEVFPNASLPAKENFAMHEARSYAYTPVKISVSRTMWMFSDPRSYQSTRI